MSAALSEPLLNFRPMVRGDLSCIVEIERLVYSFPWTSAIFRDCLEAGYFCRVLERERIITGYAVMSVDSGKSHILNFCIDPDYHRRGLGGFLLAFMLDIAQKNKAETTSLEVRPSNRAAQRFYRQAGFVEVGTRRNYYPARVGREDAVVMSLKISVRASPQGAR